MARVPRQRIVGGILLCVVLLAGVMLYLGLRPRTRPGNTAPENPRAAHLASIASNEFIGAEDAPPEEIAFRAASGLLDLSGRELPGIPEPSQLADLFGERMRLLLAASGYEEYQRHVIELTGLTDTSVIQERTHTTPERWRAQGDVFRAALIAPGAVASRIVSLEEVIKDRLFVGGLQVTKRDGGLYVSPDLYTSDPPTVLVELPMKYHYSVNGKSYSPDVYLRSVFVWDESTQKWLPYSVGIQDPGGAAGEVLLAPWI